MSHIREYRIKIVCPDCGKVASEVHFSCACGDSWSSIECKTCDEVMKEYFKKHPLGVRCVKHE